MALLDPLRIEADSRYRTATCLSKRTTEALRPGLVLRAKNLLYSKLAALYDPVSIRLATKVGKKNIRSVGRSEEGEHTARTRSSDDFPAFWSPIMVTSISVALRTALMSGRIAPFLRGRAGGGNHGPLTRTSSRASHRWFERSPPCWMGWRDLVWTSNGPAEIYQRGWRGQTRERQGNDKVGEGNPLKKEKREGGGEEEGKDLTWPKRMTRDIIYGEL